MREFTYPLVAVDKMAEVVQLDSSLKAEHGLPMKFTEQGIALLPLGSLVLFCPGKLLQAQLQACTASD